LLLFFFLFLARAVRDVSLRARLCVLIVCARAQVGRYGGRKEFVGGRERERGQSFFCTKPSRARSTDDEKKALRKNNQKISIY